MERWVPCLGTERFRAVGGDCGSLTWMNGRWMNRWNGMEWYGLKNDFDRWFSVVGSFFSGHFCGTELESEKIFEIVKEVGQTKRSAQTRSVTKQKSGCNKTRVQSSKLASC